MITNNVKQYVWDVIWDICYKEVMRFFSPGLEDYFLVLRIKLYHIEILRINYDTKYFLFGTIRLLAFLFLFSYFF